MSRQLKTALFVIAAASLSFVTLQIPAMEQGQKAVNSANIPLPVEFDMSIKDADKLAADGRLILLKAAQFDPLVAEPGPSIDRFWRADAEPVAGAGSYIVQFGGPILPHWQQMLKDYGAEIRGYVPNNALLVSIDVARVADLRRLPEVRWVGHFRNWYKIDPRLAMAVIHGQAAQKDRGNGVPLHVTGYKPEHGPAIQKFAVRAFGGVNVPESQKGVWKGNNLILGVAYAGLADMLGDLAASEEVHYVGEYFKPELHNNHSIWHGQTYDFANGQTEGNAANGSFPISGTYFAHGLLGQNQIVGNADSGLDRDMCYYRNSATNCPAGCLASQSVAAPGALTLSPSQRKILAYNVMPGAADGDVASCNFHGTHTVGSMVGDNLANIATGAGAVGHNTGDGNAPMAKVVFQDIGAADCTLAGIPANLSDLFQQAYNAGVRVHNNSWGSLDNTYSANAASVDSFVWNNPQMLIAFSAGNDDGKYQTTSSPSTNKNGISVAALFNAGLITTAADTDNRVATYSNGGPTADGRRKPDLSAPGGAGGFGATNNLLSALGTASLTDNNCGTQGISGTSMSSPTAAGYVTLLRQYFMEGFYPSGTATPADARTPSASLLKATMIAGARMVTQNTQSQGDSAASAATWAPNSRQGFGAILLNQAAGFATGEPAAFANYRTKLWDLNNNQGVATGVTQEYNINAATGTPLSIVLDWNDPPGLVGVGIALVNNLNLVVTAPDGTTIYRGNQFTQPGGVSHKVSTPGAAGSDSINNTEMVYLAAPTAGNYKIQVVGANVPGYNGVLQQGFALAVVGNLTATTTACTQAAPTAVTTSVTGLNQIQIDWTPAPGATRYAIYRNNNPAACGSDFAQIAQVGNVTTYTDTTVNGGYTYNYKVEAILPCESPMSSTCGSSVATGNCILKPTFSGLSSATGLAQSACGNTLTWAAGTINCPLSNSTTYYNVYRGTTPDFTPAAGNRIAKCLTGTSHTDTANLNSGNTYYYVVRSEDATTANGGPCNGGNEDTNSVLVQATPYGVGLEVGGSTWIDGAGDTTAKLNLNIAGVRGQTSPGANNDSSTPWRVAGGALDPTAGQASTYAYRNAGPQADRIYAADTCAEVSTPSLTVAAAPVSLTYQEKHIIEFDWDMVTVEQCVNNCAFWTRVADPTPVTDWGLITQTLQAGVFINGCLYNNTTDRGYNGPTSATTPTTPPAATTAYALRTHALTGIAAGDTLKIRWRMATDPGAEFRGFYLDNIGITNIRQPNACSVGAACAAATGLANNSAADASACTSTGNTVTWTAPGGWGDAGGNRTWTVLRDGTPIATGGCAGAFTEATLGCTDTSAAPSVTYTYTVRANNGCGSTLTTSGASATDLSGNAPSGLANNSAADASACAATGNNVAWTAPSSWGDTGTHTWTVLRDGTPIATGPCSGALTEATLSCTDTSASVGVAYTYSVTATNGCALTATTSGAAATDDAGDTVAPTMTTQLLIKSVNLDFSWSLAEIGATYNTYSALSMPPVWTLRNTTSTGGWSNTTDLPTATSYYYTTTALDACLNESPK